MTPSGSDDSAVNSGEPLPISDGGMPEVAYLPAYVLAPRRCLTARAAPFTPARRDVICGNPETAKNGLQLDSTASPWRPDGTDRLCFALRIQRSVILEVSRPRALHVALLAIALTSALAACYSTPHHAQPTRTPW